MVKIEMAKPINFNELITSKEAEVVSMRILNQPNSYISLFSLAKDEEITAEAMLGNRYYYCFNGNGEIFIESNKKIISSGDFLEITANHNYSIEARDNLKLIEIGEKIGDKNMENKTLKMLESANAFNLAEVVKYQEGKIVSKNLVAKPNLVMTIMSFWKGESLDPHKAPGDALVTVLDGEGKYYVDGKPFIVKKGESAVLPANIPHAVEAETGNFKMLLILVKE